jgi:uncharacterized damage-inducible protein DinB
VSSEIEAFIAIWEHEAGITRDLLKSLPADRYDFRPDPDGRSLGELAWHLAEIEAIMTHIAHQRDFKAMPSGIARPRTIPEVVTGYEKIHREAVVRVRDIAEEDLGREFPFFDGKPISVRNVLRFPLLHHLIHHRGQLMLLVRQAKAVPSRVYGPSREDTVAMKAARTN